MQHATDLNGNHDGDVISLIENSIARNEVSEARAQLRAWLHTFNPHESPGSLSEELNYIARSGQHLRDVSVVLIRLLAVPNLIPEQNANNQIERLIVDICEKNTGDICSFLSLKPKSQTYEKFAVLSNGHRTVLGLLEPLTANYGDLHALVTARKTVLGVLNHSIVRAYCGPFHLQDLKSATEVLFTSMQRMEELGSSFLQNYQDCSRTIDDTARLIAENSSFLAQDVFSPLLNTARRCVSAFLEKVKTQYQARITRGWVNNALAKRYPLNELGRELSIVLPLRNEGAGLALDVVVEALPTSDRVTFANSTTNIGSVNPGEFSVVLDALIVEASTEIDILLQVEWGEMGNPERLTAEFTLRINAQNVNVDWPTLEYSSPYSTAVAYGESFIGRADLVRTSATKLLRTVMEPFYITGQKRVGKTSLAAAVAKFAEDHDPTGSMSSHYILWGDVAHASPSASMNSLGQSIERFIFDALGTDVRLEPGKYEGSLSHLVTVSELAARVSPQKRFLIVVDEFDEIPQELFLQGNLAETFFANLRSISRRNNICLILVGGENMPFIMDRQGQKLNNFSRINLSYFSREKEWPDFQEMVRKPTAGIMNWHEDAIAEVFNASNGNPYFAKIVCAAVVESAVAARDTDITADEVRMATEAAISNLGSNSFAHLWQDGVPRPAGDREPDILRRSRVLVAAARCQRGGIPLNVENVQAKKAASLTDQEVASVLNDFVKRGVLSESGGTYRFVLPIFSRWLADVGAQQLIADNLSEELANSAIAEENKALIKSEEVVALARRWPTFRGRQIGTDEIRSWYQQVPSLKDQRVLFTLLQRTRVFSEVLVRERLRAAFEMIRPELQVPILRARNERRVDIIVTYVDGEGKSGSNYASVFAEESNISAKNIISQVDFEGRFAEFIKAGGNPQAVVIIDDLAGTGSSLSDNVADFLDRNREALAGMKVRVITIASTPVAKTVLENRFAKIDNIDVRFLTAEVLDNSSLALPEDFSGFSSKDEWERARALCQDMGSKIDKRRPLGYGGQGLLVVFPTNTPNNTIPLLRSHSKSTPGTKWFPLFERISH
ncbi:AAA family ATPase [Rhizobium leguminosarum]|uniref:AAA family ATPase n=1 Tax=Rhizobium ruizarguesonis TaxID=2081791 RepID=A0AAE4YT92_9HYPH|nr:ATP-binding protein [Rhizobium ruizarguesonis]NEI50506.1 AAA family ATPase [Rhizobium ruizarguesonis]